MSVCEWMFACVLAYCIKGNVNVCLIFPNLPNGFETGTIKTLSLIIFVGMVWQTVFADDDVSESEFSVCVKGELKAHIHISLYESNTLQE